MKRVVASCKTCAEVKPVFFRQESGVLIKSTQPLERISIDFKGPLPSSVNKYLLIVVDEYSRFPFAFPCKDMTTWTVTQCLDQILTLCGTLLFVHSDNAPSFCSHEFKTYITSRGISSSKSSIYNPAGNGQVEKTVQTVWKTIQLALKSSNLPLSQWESILAETLHSIRSLLCTTTNVTPHEGFFIFQRRSTTGMSLQFWMMTGSKAFMKHSKSDPLVDEVEIIHVNPNYAQVRCPNGRKMTVSFRNLAPCPQEDTADEKPDSSLTPVNNEEASNHKNDLPSEQDEVTPQSDADDESRASS